MAGRRHAHWDPSELENHLCYSDLSPAGLYLIPKLESRFAGCLLSRDLSFFLSNAGYKPHSPAFCH